MAVDLNKVKISILRKKDCTPLAEIYINGNSITGITDYSVSQSVGGLQKIMLEMYADVEIVNKEGV